MGNLKQQEKIEASFIINFIDNKIAKFEDAIKYHKNNNYLIQKKIFKLRSGKYSIDEIAELENEIELFDETIIELENKIAYYINKKSLIEEEINKL